MQTINIRLNTYWHTPGSGPLAPNDASRFISPLSDPETTQGGSRFQLPKTK
jgi:hypothetical protein